MTPVGLNDSTVVVVDDDTPLGRLVALHFVRAGSQRIGIVSADAARAEATAQAVFAAASGMWAVAASGDLSSGSEAQRMVNELSASLGDADIVVTFGSAPEVVSDVIRQTMVDRSEGVVIRGGASDGDNIDGGVHTCAIDLSSGRAPDELATAIVQTALAARTSLDAGTP